MTTHTCLACRDRPAVDAFACQRCMDEYHGHLAATPGIAVDLEVELARQSRKGGAPNGHTRRVDQPLPYSAAASTAIAYLRTALVTACRIMTLGDRDSLPADTIGAMADWLARREAAVALRPEAGDIVNELSDALMRARRVIDSPPDKRYIGNCQACAVAGGEPARMFARTGDAIHECRVCGAPWLVRESLERLEQELADYGLTQRELETMLPGLPRSTLDAWIRRGQLTATATTAEGEPAYRYGAVLALDARRKERKAG